MDAAASGRAVLAIDEVYRELEKKDDAAFQWLKARRAMVVDLDATVQQRVTTILAAHPRLIDTRRNRSSGDPFVIALAQVHGLSVVTGERPSGVLAKPNIPDVCVALGIPWMNVLDPLEIPLLLHLRRCTDFPSLLGKDRPVCLRSPISLTSA